MRAFTIDGYGQPLREADVPEPSVGPRDVLVQVEAAGLNHLDERIRTGGLKLVLPYRFPLVLGHDVAGTVVAAGPGVTALRPGDRVFARPRDHRIGTLAERIAVHEDDVAPAPTSTTAVEAASLPLVALTAWQALVERSRVAPGQRVLVHAGAGGVGAVAIQLAKHLGAHVATTASARNADLVRGLGADVVVDHRTQDFAAELSGYDVVLDSLGAADVARSLRVLRPGGRVVGINGVPDPAFARQAGAGPVVRLAIAAASLRTRRLAQRLGVSYEFLFVRASGAQLREVAALVDAGVVRPLVGDPHPFEQAPRALASLVAGGVRGRTVVTAP